MILPVCEHTYLSMHALLDMYALVAARESCIATTQPIGRLVSFCTWSDEFVPDIAPTFSCVTHCPALSSALCPSRTSSVLIQRCSASLGKQPFGTFGPMLGSSSSRAVMQTGTGSIILVCCFFSAILISIKPPRLVGKSQPSSWDTRVDLDVRASPGLLQPMKRPGPPSC